MNMEYEFCHNCDKVSMPKFFKKGKKGDTRPHSKHCTECSWIIEEGFDQY